MPQNQNRHQLTGLGLPNPTAGRLLGAMQTLAAISPRPLRLEQATFADDADERVASMLPSAVIGSSSLFQADVPEAVTAATVRVSQFNEQGVSLAQVALNGPGAGPSVPGQLVYEATNRAAEMYGSITPKVFRSAGGAVTGVIVDISASTTVYPYEEAAHGSRQRHEAMQVGVHSVAGSLGLYSLLQAAEYQPGVEQIHIGPASANLTRTIQLALSKLAAASPRPIDP